MSTSDHMCGRIISVSRRVMRGFTPSALVGARRNAGWSQADLARLSDVGVATIRRWEKGTASPQVDVLARVAAVLEVPISDFVNIPVSERFPGDWRVLLGLTQPQLGARAGVRTAVVGSIERGETALSDNVAERLSSALDISIAELRDAHQRARSRPPGMPA
ncbi:repressor protein (plasmid) [Rhodococcus opacus]|uniref:Repressor protein n=3 Tax=Nocardiaceae TaxID=85025 RepID=A0A1B1KHT1_RHOOP|nr:repressor protein [Rhodococcus opacus]